MNGYFLLLMLGAMLLTLVSLGIGLVAFARGGSFDRTYANRFMRLRVVCQAVALLLFALAVLTGA